MIVGGELPYNKKDIQSLMNNACGWYCCAYLHFINAFPQRSGDLYTDTEGFLSLFEDLNTSLTLVVSQVPPAKMESQSNWQSKWTPPARPLHAPTGFPNRPKIRTGLGQGSTDRAGVGCDRRC